VAHTRENDLACTAQAGRVADQFVLGPDGTQGVLNRAQVACSEIENGNHMYLFAHNAARRK
jgi:hypothetical protein